MAIDISSLGGITSINGINSTDLLSKISGIGGQSKNGTETSGTTAVFEDYYKSAMNMFIETSDYQLEADRIQQDFVTGKTDDMAAVLLAQEKAYASLNFTVQITSKIVEAYREIMRMQL